MKELTCIGCPRGCTLKIERDGDGWSVTGNTCPRGKEFAISEMTAPKRTICSTVRTAFPDAPVLPVRVSADIPDVLGLGVDVIATSSLLKHKPD